MVFADRVFARNACAVQRFVCHAPHAALLFAAACATTSTTTQPKGGPRGLHASEHLDAAHDHEEAAKQGEKWPDAHGDRAAYAIPWTRSWDAADEEARLAAIHRSKAAELHAAYDEACGSRPIEQVSVSPLHRFAVGGWNMKCHRAWMMLAPAGMENCPLDLPGIQVDARGDTEGITVSIAIKDAKLVGELQRRAAHEMEFASQR